MNDFEVECYSGCRGEEEPRAIVREGRRLRVEQIEARWIGVAGRYFRVRCSDGRVYDLLYQESEGRWSETGRA